MGLRDRLKERLSQPLRSRTSRRTDTTDSNGQQLLRQQVGSSGRNSPPDGENKVEKSPERFKDRLIQDTPIRELWNMAYEKLREQDSALIEDYEAKLIGSVTTGLGQTLNLKQNRREWMQAILSSKMEEVNNKPEPSSLKAQAKDTMQLVLNIVNSANDYISNATSANPCTSIAWAGVSFFLPLLMNIAAEQTSLVKGLEYIASLIVQSRMKEELYVECYELGTHNHKRFRESHTQYKTALERLYVYILKFQATACCYYSNSSILRHGLDALKWKDWASLVDEIREQERNFAAVEEMWRDIKRYEKHLTTISTFSEMNAKLSALADKEFADLLRWLCDVDPSSMYNAGLDRREAGTCEWLIKDSEEFKSWEASDGSLLWLHGKAGSGKSILSSSVIKYLRDQYVTEPSTVVSYFYFSFSDPEKQKVDVMLASLTKQICARWTKRSQLMERLGQYKISGQRPDTETLEAVLIASASEFANVYIVIDALDECPLLNEQRGKLLISLRRILAIAPNKFHFFLTSRKEPDIDNKIRPILSSTDKNEIDLLARQYIINRDIIHYIDSQLNGDEYKSWPESVKEEARESLVEKADCMFQYVQLQLEALRHYSSESEVREALQNLPIGLDATYNRVLESIPPHCQERVIHSLKWLAFSRMALSIEELAEIFTIRPHNDTPFSEKERPFSPTDILKYFSGLIIAQEDNSWWRPQIDTQIRLVHFSLKEYLISKRLTQGPALAFSFTEVDAQLSIVKSCLVYLNCLSHWIASRTEEFLSVKKVKKLYPLANYAACHWMAHLEEVRRSLWPPDIERDAASALAVHSQRFLTLLAVSGDRKEYILKPYYYTAQHGHVQLTKMLINRHSGSGRYVTREELDEPLQQMAYKGDTDMMKVFLEAGADVNAQCGKWDSPLQAAAAGGHLDGLKLLISRGANINSPSNGYKCLLTCRNKMDNECLQFLLDSGSDINMQDKQHKTALHRAISDGHDANVDLLLTRGANVNLSVTYYTPLQFTCRYCSQPKTVASYVKMLLERGADPNLRGEKKDAALQLACNNRSLFPNHQVAMEIVQLLVKNGTVENEAIINDLAEAEENILAVRSPKTWAKGWLISKSAVEVLKLLLENGARIDDLPVLHMACMGRDKERVRWLLDQGADVNAKSHPFGTPLHAVLTYVISGGEPTLYDALRFGLTMSFSEETIAIVQLLISKGAQINHIGGEYGTALQAACSNRALDVEMVRFLLEQGADVNAEGGEYGRALIAACLTDQEVDLIRILLEHGADINAEGGKYGTALMTLCAFNPNADLIRILLEHGADVNVEGGTYETALAATIWHGPRIHLVRLLLEHGADVNSEGWSYGSALIAACESDGEGDLIRLLLEQGADANAKKGHYGTALMTICALNPKVDLVRLLLEHGADVNAEGGSYGTVLADVCLNGKPELVQLLLENGANPHDKNYAAWNAVARRSLSTFYQDDGIEVLELLFEQVTDPHHRNRGLGTALIASLETWDTYVEKVEQRWHKRLCWLLEHGADVNFKGGKYGFALQTACVGASDRTNSNTHDQYPDNLRFHFDDIDDDYNSPNNINSASSTTKLFLDQCPNINVNAQGGIFGSALQAAAFSGQTESVRLLLDRGADVNARGGKCGSALNAAIFRGYWDIVEILLQKGATPDCRLRQQPDEEWLHHVEGEWLQFVEDELPKDASRGDAFRRDARYAIARYRKFWEVESGSAAGTK